MFRGCIHTATKQLGRAVSGRLAVSSTVVPSFGTLHAYSVGIGKASVQRRFFTHQAKVPLDYGEPKQEESPKEDENDMDPEEFEAVMNEDSKKDEKKEEKKESHSETVNPLEYYMREEMYPGMSEEVIEKLHFPEHGLPEGALLEDLPLFPNPLDHSGDEDTETDPAKVRTKPYDFNGADVRLETREVVIPRTWEDDKLGPPAQNRLVRLTVHVRQLGLPVVAAQKLVLMAGPRYNFNNDLLTLTTDRHPTRKQNGRYLMDLLESLVEEAKKETKVAAGAPRRLPVKRGRFLPFNKDLLGSSMVKKQYEGMITEDE